MPPNPRHFQSGPGYEAALLQHGWKRIGGGAGGGVYHRAGDSDVIKVSAGDECYLAFATFALLNPQTCLPRLQIVHRGNGWAVTQAEHLLPLSASNAFEVGRWWGSYLTAKRAGTAVPPPSTWSSLADALGDIARAESCGLDVKVDNVMERAGTEEIVFIDLLF